MTTQVKKPKQLLPVLWEPVMHDKGAPVTKWIGTRGEEVAAYIFKRKEEAFQLLWIERGATGYFKSLEEAKSKVK